MLVFSIIKKRKQVENTSGVKGCRVWIDTTVNIFHKKYKYRALCVMKLSALISLMNNLGLQRNDNNMDTEELDDLHDYERFFASSWSISCDTRHRCSRHFAGWNKTFELPKADYQSGIR